MSREMRVREIDRHKAQPQLTILTPADIEEGIRLMSPRYFTGLAPGILKGSPQFLDHYEYRKNARDVTKQLIESLLSQPK
ncbi:hypothetical protein [Edaphovirga cremea]|uniref:hypothetical protein n=1 Tax=Edaphovirga cremea TaxID=2267246 RepID=UPI003988F656